ncbi:ribonuclease H-like protein [Chiua virens]|nr:ribonuclease H-like protein [Chiua virens]
MTCQCKGLDHLFEPPCHLASEYNTAQLIQTCSTDICRGRFFARCKEHENQLQLCHHYRVVYTDGACTNNGAIGAVSGIGIAFGTEGEEKGYQFSIPVDDNLDPGGKRTNQRAELLAALEGLKKIGDHDRGFFAHSSSTRTRPGKSSIVVTTDSRYVVEGMTRWLPKWKANGMRKASKQRPSNLDLFLKLDTEMTKREQEHDCNVMFWYIAREYNAIADGLAKHGANSAANVPNRPQEEYSLATL